MIVIIQLSCTLQRGDHCKRSPHCQDASNSVFYTATACASTEMWERWFVSLEVPAGVRHFACILRRYETALAHSRSTVPGLSVYLGRYKRVKFVLVLVLPRARNQGSLFFVARTFRRQRITLRSRFCKPVLFRSMPRFHLEQIVFRIPTLTLSTRFPYTLSAQTEFLA